MSAFLTSAGRAIDSLLKRFGEPVTYLPAAGESQSIVGIPHDPAQFGEYNPDRYAIRYVKLADLSAPPQKGDIVTIGAEQFAVFEIHNEGTGGAYLVLEKR